MACRVAGLRDSLKTHIETGEPYNIAPVTISVTWFPYLERELIGTKTEIVVAPVEMAAEAIARSSSSFARQEESIDLAVHVRKTADRTNTADVDRVAELVEQVFDQVKTHEPGTISGEKYTLRGVRYEPFFDPAGLVEFRVFEARILASYVRYST